MIQYQVLCRLEMSRNTEVGCLRQSVLLLGRVSNLATRRSLSDPPVLILLLLDPSLLEHVSDDGSVVGAIKPIGVHPWILWQTELALSRYTTVDACSCKYVGSQLSCNMKMSAHHRGRLVSAADSRGRGMSLVHIAARRCRRLTFVSARPGGTT